MLCSPVSIPVVRIEEFRTMSSNWATRDNRFSFMVKQCLDREKCIHSYQNELPIINLNYYSKEEKSLAFTGLYICHLDFGTRPEGQNKSIKQTIPGNFQACIMCEANPSDP